MEVFRPAIKGLLVIKPKVIHDTRGYFLESFRLELLRSEGIQHEFVQDNESKSAKNVLRGLHFQNPPHAQGKLVRVVQGAVLDVAVDIRKGSPTYGQHFTIELNEENKSMLWIPPGFAHGFLTLADDTIFQYKCTAYYNRPSEGSVLWNDRELNIDWRVKDPIVSEKDMLSPAFNTLESKF